MALVRNVVLNFIGELSPLVVSLLALPVVIRGLGIERFGVLSLAWVLIGYFNLFDLGLGRATTKCVAEHVETGDQSASRRLVWTALLLQGMLGSLGGLLLAVATPFLTASMFHVSAGLVEEAKRSLYWLSVSVPFLMLSSALRGVLEARQRFDLVNAVKAPANCLLSLAPVIGVALRFDLPSIMLLQVLGIAGSTLLYYALVCKVFPGVKGRAGIDVSAVRSLATFAGWTTLILGAASGVVHLERVLLGMMLPVSAVGYYMPAYALASKLWIIPQSVFLAAFPAFSALAVTQKEELERLFIQTLRLTVVSVGIVAITLVFFADPFLTLWLGRELAQHCQLSLQILAVGFFLNSQAWVPSTLLQGLGRVKVVAYVFLCELPLYSIVTWWLIRRMGIEGAALAWAVRGSAEAVVFLAIAGKALSFSPRTLIRNGVLAGFLLAAVLAVAVGAMTVLGLGLLWRIGIGCTVLGAYGWYAWNWLVSPGLQTRGRWFVELFRGILVPE